MGQPWDNQDMASGTGLLRQNSLTGQPEQVSLGLTGRRSQDITATAGQQHQESHGQDCCGRTAGTGQSGRDNQGRTAGTGHPEKTVGTVYIQDRKNTGQDYQNRTRGWDIHGRSVAIGHLGQGQSDRTAGAGYPGQVSLTSHPDRSSWMC
jgi:hypothetical protein